MPAGPESATHQQSDELKQAEVIDAVGFGVDHPFGLVLSGLMPVVGRRNEQAHNCRRELALPMSMKNWLYGPASHITFSPLKVTVKKR